MESPRFHAVTFHGPVPTGRSLSASTPFLIVYSRGTIGSRPIASHKFDTGSLVWMRTVESLTFSHRVTTG